MFADKSAYQPLTCWLVIPFGAGIAPFFSFFFLGGVNLLCYAAATAARLKTQVYDCVGFYCIPVQELRDVHIYRGRCYNCGKTLQKNTRQSLADLRLHQKISEN